MTKKVYIAQEVPHLNLMPARKFGELITVCSIGNMTTDINRTIRKIKDRLDAMDRDDYLLPVGDPVIIGLTMAIALRYVDRLQVLRWDRQESEYEVIVIQEV